MGSVCPSRSDSAAPLTAEQWIREGKQTLNWTWLSCHDCDDNQVRLQLFVLVYNLGNFLRSLAVPGSVQH